MRRILYFSEQRLAAPRLEKVKAHNEQWLRLGHPMAMGNDSVDALAKRAAQEEGVPPWSEPEAVHRDPWSL